MRRSMPPDVPESIFNNLTHLLAVSDAFTHADFVRIKALGLPETKTQVLIVPVPDLRRFAPKPPFGGHCDMRMGIDPWPWGQSGSIDHCGRTIRTRRLGLSFKPKKMLDANVGVFGLGRQFGRDSNHIGNWVLMEILNAALEKGKGQQTILTSAI